MIRIAVVDDENIVCTQLERLINEAADIISITVEIDIYSSSEAFVKILKANEKYDLIFLDIELDKYSGIDISHCIRNELSDDSTQIVFVSGKNGYDRQLFEFRPIDFLEKPIDVNKMINCLSFSFLSYQSFTPHILTEFNFNPVSSCTSLLTEGTILSPGSIFPPGKATPFQLLILSCTNTFFVVGSIILHIFINFTFSIFSPFLFKKEGVLKKNLLLHIKFKFHNTIIFFMIAFLIINVNHPMLC